MSILGDYSKVGKSALNVLNPSGILNQDFNGIHFQRNYMWEIILPMVGELGGILQGNIPIPGILISKLCQKVTFGDYAIDGAADTTRFGAFEAKYPGTMTIEQLKLNFIKTIPDIVTTYFTSWRKSMISKSGIYAPKSQYAKTIQLVFLDTTGIPVNRYKFTGVFPISMPKYTLAYGEETISHLDIILNVDMIETLY